MLYTSRKPPLLPRNSVPSSGFLEFSNRHTGGHDYDLLCDALDRLDSTRLRTTIRTAGEETWEAFGLIEGAKIKRKRLDGRVTEWGLKLSGWLFRAIEANEVLTLHPDYFRLRKPIERRIYEIARKHCGSKDTWQIGLKKLQKKYGSSDAIRNFRLAVRALCDFDHMPDYSVSMESDLVSFRSRVLQQIIDGSGFMTRLDPETFEAARQVAPGWDVYVIERECRTWVTSLLEQGMEPLRNPDSAFIGFCRNWASHRG